MDALRGKHVLMTGATDGIGLDAAKRLGRAGARLTLHGRSAEKLARAQALVGSEARVVLADLTSLAEVRGLVDTVIEPIDVLIQNAGVGAGADTSKREVSRDNYELRWAVNFLAPFAFLEWLIAAGKIPSAIVNVASIGQAPLNFADLNSRSGYEGWNAYRKSKLALITWTQTLARRGFHALAMHPGSLLATNMVREAGVAPLGTVESGGEAVVHAAQLALTGEHDGAYIDVKTPARANAFAYDEQNQRKLQHDAAGAIARFGRGLSVV